MKHFWALPALLRPALVLASQHTFSVYDDILAFPQYEVHFSEEYVSEEQAQSQLKSQSKTESQAHSEVEHYTHRTNNDARNEHEEREKEEDLEYERVILNDQQYLCSIPQVDKPVEQSNQNDTLSKAEEEKELARANDRGWELLAGMQGNCVYYLSGWWSYRFCYNQDVKQFHQLPPSRGMPPFPPVEDPNVQAYFLGKYDETKTRQAGQAHSEEKWEGEGALEISEHATRMTGGQGELVARGQSRYLTQKLEDGTECDLTGKPRVIEVQYHCNPSISSDRIMLIKETTTCAYLMVVHTSRLCDDVAFFPPQKDAANSITCRPILRPDEADNYEHNQKIIKTAMQEAQIWEDNPEAAAIFGMLDEANENDMPAQIVGDIVIGAHQIVPADVEIEKSGIAGGRGREKYIDTIANSWGKDLSLSKEDMERLGLEGGKSVEKLKELKKELQKQAKGEKWRLDVVDTPNGREYRGIYGADVQEDDNEARQKQNKKDGGASGKEKKDGGEDDKKDEGEQGSGDQQGSEEEYYKEEL